MVVVEVVLGLLGALAVIVLMASLVMAVVGLTGAVFGLAIERCERCGRMYLASPDLALHRCTAHHALSLARVWQDHHGFGLRHH